MLRKEHPMTEKEIVRALRNCKAYKTKSDLQTTMLTAADLIKSLQAQLSDEKIVSQSLRNAANGYKAQLAASQRRERAAVEDMKLIVDAVREEHCDETCCFACKFDCDTSITDSGDYACECPGFERDDCFEWRGPQEKGDKDE